jgi:7,8-dihydropterin-6-yl-methyl-4-(beta-D-ribofuranosyl)aminobenzene 5'-phosphate synthase
VIVAAVKQTFDDEIYLVMGGFHLESASTSKLDQIIQDLKDLGVKKVAPSHCTGLKSIQYFQDVFGADFLDVGVGTVIEIDS